MIVRKEYCDICGKEISCGFARKLKIEIIKRISICFTDNVTFIPKEYDICEECNKGLKEWFENRKKEVSVE